MLICTTISLQLFFFSTLRCVCVCLEWCVRVDAFRFGELNFAVCDWLGWSRRSSDMTSAPSPNAFNLLLTQNSKHSSHQIHTWAVVQKKSFTSFSNAQNTRISTLTHARIGGFLFGWHWTLALTPLCFYRFVLLLREEIEQSHQPDFFSFFLRFYLRRLRFKCNEIEW